MSHFDTTPEPRFLRGLQNQNWNVAGALAELVDNSFGAGRGDARRVEIAYDPKTKIMAVLDGGAGMQAVGELFKLGATAGRTPGDIGEYGQGGTLALLWLFEKIHVWTLRDSRVSDVSMKWEDVFTMDAFPLVSDDWRIAKPTAVPDDLLALGHGTLIIGKLLKERRFQVSNVRRDLAAKFAPAVRYGKELVWRSPSDEQYLSNPLPAFAPGKGVAIDLVLETPDGQHLGVRGEIGEIPDLPLNRSRVHVGFGPRVIMETRDFFEPVDSEERFRVAGIAGWLDLLDGWQPYLATTKDAINDTPVYEALRSVVFAKIEKLLQELRKARESLLLNEITLDLNAALDSGVQTEIPIEEPEEVAIDQSPTGTRRTKREHDPVPETKEGDHHATSPRVARLELAPLTDLEIAGRLCHAEKQNGDIAVFINSEHPVVRTALEKEPMNRLALALMVLGPVSDVLHEDQDLRKRVFPPKLLRALDCADESVRQGLIHRVLIDRVHGVTV